MVGLLGACLRVVGPLVGDLPVACLPVACLLVACLQVVGPLAVSLQVVGPGVEDLPVACLQVACLQVACLWVVGLPAVDLQAVCLRGVGQAYSEEEHRAEAREYVEVPTSHNKKGPPMECRETSPGGALARPETNQRDNGEELRFHHMVNGSQT